MCGWSYVMFILDSVNEFFLIFKGVFDFFGVIWFLKFLFIIFVILLLLFLNGILLLLIDVFFIKFIFRCIVFFGDFIMWIFFELSGFGDDLIMWFDWEGCCFELFFD